VTIGSISGGGFEATPVAHSTNNSVSTTIVDDDQPQISISDATTTEGGDLEFVVTLDQAPVSSTTVDFATATGTATAGDFTGSTGTLTFAVGETSKTITISTVNDTTYEPDETLNVNLANASGAVIADAQGVGTITENDQPSLSVSDVTVTEGDDPYAEFAISLSNISSIDTVVSLALNSGMAIAGTDFANSLEFNNAGTWQPVTGNLTIAAGQTSINVRTAITDDPHADDNEQFTLVATRVTGVTTNASATGTGTIRDEAAPTAPTVSISGPATVSEGDTTTDYTVTLNETPLSPVTINLTYSGTAADGTDYTSQATVTIPAGSTAATFTLDSIEDTLVESNETVVVTIGSISGGGFEATPVAHATNNSVTTTIVDDDQPQISISDATTTEGGDLEFVVMLDQVPVTTTTVDFATATGTAVAGDFTTSAGTLMFAVGETSKTITISTINDTTYELNETLNVNLSNASGAVIADAQGVGTITENDQPSLSVSDVTVTEGDDPYAEFTISLSNTSSIDTVVSLTLNSGSAIAGTDFANSLEFNNAGTWQPVTGNLTIAAGLTSINVRTGITDDPHADDNEQFTLVATRVTGVTTNASATGTGTILDEATPNAPTVSITGPAIVNEGDTTTDYTVTLSETPLSPVTISLTYTGTAADGTDYTGQVTVTIPAGSTTGTFTLDTIDDSLVEPGESIVVGIGSIAGGGFEANPVPDGLSNSVSTTIVSDDVPEITVGDATVNESDGTMAFVVSLSQPAVSVVIVEYTIQTGTADNNDFVFSTGVVTFNVGESSRTVSVVVVDDLVYEPDEVLSIQLSNPTNATISDDTGIGTILENDLPTVQISDVTVTEGQDSYAVFDVSLSNPSVENIQLSLTLSDGTATIPDDAMTLESEVSPGVWAPVTGPISIAAGETAARVRVQVIDDVWGETSETFSLSAAVQSGTTANSVATGLGTILDEVVGDAATLTLNVPATIDFNNPVPSIPLQIDVAPASDMTVIVSFGGLDTNGNSVTTTSTVVIPAGSTTVSVPVGDPALIIGGGVAALNVQVQSSSGGGFEAVELNGAGTQTANTILPPPSVAEFLDNNYRFDSFTDRGETAKGFGSGVGGHVQPRNVVLSKLISSLAPEPILSGFATPGTIMVARIYRADGSVHAEATTRVDASGNWVMQFYNSKHTADGFIVIEHVATDSVQLGNARFRLTPDTYRSLQFDTQHTPSTTIGSVLGNAPSMSLLQQHHQNQRPIDLE
ncbi:MAG: Calx-beta domain-containing protein, partial [Planctomycetota bacterium]